MSFYDTIKSFVITQHTTDEAMEGFTENLTANTAMTFLCIVSTLLACVKVMFFLQMFSSFGQLVQLVSICLTRIQDFMKFMLIWIFYFAFSYFVLGSEIDRGDDFSVLSDVCINSPESDACKAIQDEVGAVGNDYSDLGDFFSYIILAWRNSIGDLTTPKYPGWLSVQKNKTQATAVVNVIVVLIWVHWLLTQFLVLIILLNFLIAIVGLAFDEVIDLDKITTYEQRAQLNKEYRYFRKMVGGWIRHVRLPPVDFMVCSTKEGQTDVSEWKGFVKTIRAFFKNQKKQITDKFTSQESQFQRSHETTVANLKKIETVIRQVQEKNDDKIDDLSANVQKLSSLIKARISPKDKGKGDNNYG